MRRRLLLAIVVLLAVPVGALLWLVYTEAGLQRIVRQLNQMDRFGITLQGAAGTLAGPLHVQRFELDHRRVHIILHDIDIDFRVRGVGALSASVRSLSARDAYIAVRRTPPTTEPQKPLRFLPQFLRIKARDVELARVRYVNINGLTIDADRVTAQRVRLSSSRLHVDRIDVQAPQFTLHGNYRMDAQRPLRLAAAANVQLRPPRGAALQLDATLSGTIDELLMAGQLSSPDIAAIRATLTRPNGSWRVRGSVHSPSLSLENLLAKPPFRLHDVSLQFDAQPTAIRTVGELTVPQLGALLVDAAGKYEEKRLSVHSAQLTTRQGKARLTAQGVVEFGGKTAHVDAQARWTDLQWPVAGEPRIRSPSGRLSLSGAMPYIFTVAGALGGDKVPAADVMAAGELSKDGVRLEAYEVRTLDGLLQGAGTLSYGRPQQWSFTARAKNLDPAPLYATLPGKISFSARARGTGLDRAARFDASVTELTGTLRQQRLHGRGRVLRRNGEWRLDNVDARWGDAHARVTGVIGPRLDVSWSMQAQSLGRFLPQLGGQVRSDGWAKGTPHAPQIVMNAAGSNLRYGDWRAASLQLQADLDAGSDHQSSLHLQASNVGRDVPVLHSLKLTGSGTRAAHDLTLALTGMGSNSERPGEAQLRIHGRYLDGIWSAAIAEATATDDGRTFRLHRPASLFVARDQASMEQVCLLLGDGRICAQGQWQRSGPWSGELNVDRLPLASVLGVGMTQQFGGTVSGRVRGGSMNSLPWRGEADLHIDDATLQYRLTDGSIERVQLGSGALAAAVGADEIAFNVDLRALENTFLQGQARLKRLQLPLMRMPLSGQIAGRTADANLLPLFFPTIDRAAGILEADIDLGGTLAAPQIAGGLALSDGELDFYQVNLALRDLKLTAHLQDTGLKFEAATRAGAGHATASGELTWHDGRLQGLLHLSGKDLLVSDLPEYRVVASPDLNFHLDGSNIAAAGDVVIPSARIEPVDFTGAVRVSEDAQLIGEHAAQRTTRLHVSSEIRVVIGEDVLLNTSGLQGQLQGSVGTTTRTGEVPIGRGELSVKNGRYEAYGQNLDIIRGRLLFDAVPLGDPGLDIQAERKREQVKVGLNVRGTLRAPRLSFYSEPSMPQSQIVEFLLVGRTLDEYQNRDAQTAASTGNSLALQGGGLLASRISERIGLGEVGIESDVETGASLVLGRFLSPRLFVSYGISLAEAINTLKMRYTISDRWILRTESGEQHAADLEFTIER